jgi:hypothetical protein
MTQEAAQPPLRPADGLAAIRGRKAAEVFGSVARDAGSSWSLGAPCRAARPLPNDGSALAPTRSEQEGRLLWREMIPLKIEPRLARQGEALADGELGERVDIFSSHRRCFPVLRDDDD